MKGLAARKGVHLHLLPLHFIKGEGMPAAGSQGPIKAHVVQKIGPQGDGLGGGEICRRLGRPVEHWQHEAGAAWKHHLQALSSLLPPPVS